MDKKILYLLLTFIIIIVLIVVSIIGIIVTRNKSEKKDDINNNIIVENSNTINEENEVTEGYNEEILKEFGIEIKGMTSEITNKIKDTEDFYYNLKKYIHESGFIEVTTIELKNYKQDRDELKLKFQLQDSKKTKIIATIKLNKNVYEFIYY